MLKDMTSFVRKLSDIKNAIGELDLPIYGFRREECHVMAIKPSFGDLVKGSAMLDKAGAALGLAKIGNAIMNIADPEYVPSELLSSHIPSQVLFYWNLIKISGIWSFVVPRMNFLRAYQFYGVQPQRYKGFTYHVNPIYNTDPDSMMRHIISPYEYIIYNAPVHAVADAEVMEVVMDRPDDIHETKNLNFGSVDVEEHLGNIIRLRVNKVVDFVYGGLQKSSSKLQVGDIVKRGDFIARVGASAWSKVPFLYLGLSYIGPRIPIAGNLAKPFEMEKLPFLTHMQCDLVDLRRMGSSSSAGKDPYAIFTHIDPMAIEYKPMVRWLTQCCLVKKFPTILSP